MWCVGYDDEGGRHACVWGGRLRTHIIQHVVVLSQSLISPNPLFPPQNPSSHPQIPSSHPQIPSSPHTPTPTPTPTHTHSFLVDSPPNIATPTFLAQTAQEIAQANPDVVTCEILSYEQCREMNMGCYLGVAEASYPDEPPQFIHLKYTPGMMGGCVVCVYSYFVCDTTYM